MSEVQTQEPMEDLSTKAKIVKFIDALSDEKYASANKYLQSAVEDKLTDKIRQAAGKPIFK
jgi:SLT domain-containing protein